MTGASPQSVANAAGVRPHQTYTHAFKGFAAPLQAAAVEHLRRNPRVDFIEPDREFHTTLQTFPTGVDRIDGETNSTANIDNLDDRVDVDVAVIDTGVDFDHPDINVSRTRAVDCTKGSPRKPNCVLGEADDDDGHGTHVSGTIGALDDDNGVVGVAPGARIWAVRVLKRGSGWTSWIAAGIDWVAAHGGEIEVANMSLGGTGSDDTDGGDCHASTDAMHCAICGAVDAGVVFVVAAGNESDDAANHTPAAYDEVITVSALSDFDGAPYGAGAATCRTDEDDNLANFSNYGPDVDIIASGVCIFSSWLGGGYNTISGTSMASPHVAGGAALYVAATGRDQNGDGAINAADVAAVRQALIDAGDPNPCDTGPGDTSACSDDPDGVQEPMLYVGSPAAPCSADSECDDGNECTTDTCASGACGHTAVAEDSSCGGGAGLCCAGSCAAAACSGDADCDDGSECTTDSCASPGTCAAACGNAPVAEDTSCNGGAGLCCGGACAAPGCGSDADCDDAQTCTGDTCDNAGTCAAACNSVWPACGAVDACCGPSCDGGSDSDCSSTICGNGVCEGDGEDCGTCPADCRCAGGSSCGKGCCGDGLCTGSEKARNCPIDCA